MAIIVTEGQDYTFQFGYFKGEDVPFTVEYSIVSGSAAVGEDLTFTPVSASRVGGWFTLNFRALQDQSAEGTETATMLISGTYGPGLTYSYVTAIEIRDDDVRCEVDLDGNGSVEVFEGSLSQLAGKANGVYIRLEGARDQLDLIREATDTLNEDTVLFAARTVLVTAGNIAGLALDIFSLGGASVARGGLSNAWKIIDNLREIGGGLKDLYDFVKLSTGEDGVPEKLFGTLAYSLQLTKVFAENYKTLFSYTPIAGSVLKAGADLEEAVRGFGALRDEAAALDARYDATLQKQANLSEALSDIYACLAGGASISTAMSDEASSTTIVGRQGIGALVDTIDEDLPLVIDILSEQLLVISTNDTKMVFASDEADHLASADLGPYAHALVQLGGGDDIFEAAPVDEAVFETVDGGSGIDEVRLQAAGELEFISFGPDDFWVYTDSGARWQFSNIEKVTTDTAQLQLSGVDVGTGGEVSRSAALNTVALSLQESNPDAEITFTRTLTEDSSGAFRLEGDNLVVADRSLLRLYSFERVTLTFEVLSSSGETITEHFEIMLTNANEAPLAQTDIVQVREDATTNNLWSQLLTNDSDPEASPLRISAVDTKFTLGTVQFDAASQTLRYVADDDSFDRLRTGAVANDSFTYTVIDEEGLTNTATVQVSVIGIADSILRTGTARADTLTGTGGDDRIWGGEGRDSLSGGSGNDILAGEEGQDQLTGGEGRDTFAFSPFGGKDTITDFSVNDDMLTLENWVFVAKTKVSDVDHDGRADLTLTFGGRGPEASVTLLGVTNYSAVHIEHNDSFINPGPF